MQIRSIPQRSPLLSLQNPRSNVVSQQKMCRFNGRESILGSLGFKVQGNGSGFSGQSLRLWSTVEGGKKRSSLLPYCIGSSNKLFGDHEQPEGSSGSSYVPKVASAADFGGEVREREDDGEEGFERQSLWKQLKQIVEFSGPAMIIWLSAPAMSLVDTAVVGRASSIELAALGPATVLCDYVRLVFVFLSVVTSNIIAVSLAGQDKEEVQHQISILLCVGLTCGLLLLSFIKFYGAWALTAFAGPKNSHIVAVSNGYIQIRALAWPAVLVGLVAQGASLGMKDSLRPMKALAIGGVLNAIGDVVLCNMLGYGIRGAAFAAIISQFVAAYVMIEGLNQKGYNAFAIKVPKLDELITILRLGTPVFVTTMSKMAFYSVMIYVATSMGTYSVAAHQVMVQIFTMCGVCGEPLSQTSQSFMPELIYGANRNLAKARSLLKSIVSLGMMVGLVLAAIGTAVPLLFPNIFTQDQMVVGEMHKIVVPYFIALAITPFIQTLEGTLLAGRDLRFLSLSMTSCFSLGAVVLVLVSSKGYGLPGCWFALVGFQCARLFLAFRRLLSPNGMLYSDDQSKYKLENPKAA
ncbi:unnamed protein product [Linum tenue]|uniref:Protein DETOXIFICATION n=1 Tax=Linum tenue TaxID=586396 RepID=A0AAV0H1N4_9ROSI|nr:unnamed protein product [Linum tenue]